MPPKPDPMMATRGVEVPGARRGAWGPGGECRVFEQFHQIEIAPEAALDLGVDTDELQRVAAKVDKAVVPPDAVEAERCTPDRGDFFLRFALWGHEHLAGVRPRDHRLGGPGEDGLRRPEFVRDAGGEHRIDEWSGEIGRIGHRCCGIRRDQRDLHREIGRDDAQVPFPYRARQAFQEIATRPVAPGVGETNRHLGETVIFRQRPEVAEHPLLHTLAKRAAAQEESLD